MPCILWVLTENMAQPKESIGLAPSVLRLSEVCVCCAGAAFILLFNLNPDNGHRCFTGLAPRLAETATPQEERAPALGAKSPRH